MQEGGVSGFLHAFVAEVFAMVRAHVAALGGNAVVSYIMKQCVFMENPNKNQVRGKDLWPRMRECPPRPSHLPRSPAKEICSL